MWYQLGKNILRYRLALLVVLFMLTGIMTYFALQAKLSYEFTRAIPIDNPKYKDYQSFLKKFGGDADIMVVGIESEHFFTPKLFNAFYKLHQQLKKIEYVVDVLSIPEVVTLKKDSSTEKLIPQKIFHFPYSSQQNLDSDRAVFENLPFYTSLLYNPSTKSYLLGVSLNKSIINSKRRTELVGNVVRVLDSFEMATQTSLHVSGLPYIRTIMGTRIKKEMNLFLLGSFLLSALALLLFFRSISAMIMSLLVVGMGVVWSLGTLVLCGYQITLLTALIPPLIVVIGIPNCIYFLNKYHASFKETNEKETALITMIGKMGIVTFSCNVAAAIGFAVFAFTQSQLLKEFGVVAGLNIMFLFFISLVFIPPVLSYLPSPKPAHIRYLDNKTLEKILLKIEKWAFHYTKTIYAVTGILLLIAVIGIFRLKSEGFIVDDMPKKDKVYTDLKWFESNFGGVMPLEIIVNTKRKNGLVRNTTPIKKIDEFSAYIASNPQTSKPLSFVEGLKFAKQAYFDGDSASYRVPYEGDMAFLGGYLKTKPGTVAKSGLTKMINGFIDSTKQVARISVNMKDIGSAKLPLLIKDFENKALSIFDTASYSITFTGSSITFLEGSSFIINGLKDSIIWAFVLITICMFFLFRSFKILLCSLIPNLIPLVFTAGLMGWMNVALKPSTVLVFSVALGIVIDVTIRFLINYKQELPKYNFQIKATLVQTIRHTGISIMYTSLVLIAGFVIFCFSSFGGTNSLGWLTSFTLIIGTLTNLIFLPVLIISTAKKKDW